MRPAPESPGSPEQSQHNAGAVSNTPEIPHEDPPVTRANAHEQAESDEPSPDRPTSDYIGRPAVRSTVYPPETYTHTPPVRVVPARSRFGPRRPSPRPRETTAPQVRPEIDRSPLPGTARVQALEERTKTTKDAATGKEAGRRLNTMPDQRAIAQAATAQRPMARFFSWLRGEAHVSGTPESLPPTARTRPLAGSAQAANGHEGASTTGATATAMLERPVPQTGLTWARLKHTYQGLGGVDKAAESPTQDDDHTRLEEVTRKHGDDNFTVAIIGQGLNREQQDSLIRKETNKGQDKIKTTLSPTAANDASTHASNTASYMMARQRSGLLQETVAVGVEDIAHLEEIAEHAARAILNGGDPQARYIRFDVERNPDGSVKQYNSLDDVIAADAADPDGPFVVTAGEYAAHVELPDEPLPGMKRHMAPTNFDVERPLPEGTAKVKFAEILDNDGNPTGRPLEMPREHTGILAQTNAGKSVLIRGIITDIKRQCAERLAEYKRLVANGRADEASWDNEAVIVFDCKKRDVYTDPLSRQIKGARTEDGSEIPDEFAEVHHAVPGAAGPGIRFNLIRPTQNSPESWRGRIGQAAKILAAPYKGMKGDVYKTLKQYLGSSIKLGVRAFGLDPKTGRSLYPFGTPYTPSGEYMGDRVEDVARGRKLRGDYGTNIVGYAKSEIETAYEGADGAPLAAEGYDWDARAALEIKGVVSIDLKLQTSIESRQLTVLSGLYDIYDACVQKNLEQGIIGETDKVHVTVVVDEADIFTNDDLGAELADFFTHARSVGMRIVYAKQGDIEGSIHKQVWVNTPNKIIGRTGYTPDVVAFAGAAGMTTVEDMDSAAGAAAGQFTYHGFGMTRAVRGQVANPHNPAETPMGIAVPTAGVEHMTQLGMDQEQFDWDLKVEARTNLAADPTAAQISNWAEDAVISVLSGRGLNAIGGQLEADLRAALNDPNDPRQAALARCIISEAVQNAINGRPDLQRKAPREAYAAHIIPHLQAIARGERLEGWDQPRRDLALDVGKLNPAYDPDLYDPNLPDEAQDPNSWMKFIVAVDGRFGHAKDTLTEMTDGPVHADTDVFAEKLGVKLWAEGAYEQRDELLTMRLVAVTDVSTVVGAIANRKSVTGTELGAAQARIANLVGGSIGANAFSPEQIREAAVNIVSQIELQQNAYEYSPAQRLVLRSIVDDMPIADLTRDTGYNTVLVDLFSYVKTNESTRPGLSAEDFLAMTGEALPEGVTTANEQRKYVERKLEQKHMETVSYASKIRPNKLLFCIDTIRPGHAPTLDGNVDVLEGQEHPDGPAFESVNMAKGKPARPSYTLAERMQRREFEEWKTSIAEHFLYTPTIIRTSADVSNINRLFSSVSRQLWERHQADEKLRKQDAEVTSKTSASTLDAGDGSDPMEQGVASGVPG